MQLSYRLRRLHLSHAQCCKQGDHFTEQGKDLTITKILRYCITLHKQI